MHVLTTNLTALPDYSGMRFMVGRGTTFDLTAYADFAEHSGFDASSVCPDSLSKLNADLASLPQGQWLFVDNRISAT